MPFFFTTLLYYEPGKDFLRLWALGLFLLASLTDAIDGMVARFFKEVTPLGKFLDPLADKLLLISGFVGIYMAKSFPLLPPLWVVVAVVFRDVVILGGLVVLYFSGTPATVNPNFLGKATTAFQMATLISTLLLLPFSVWFWYGTAILTVTSGLTYVFREMRRLRW